MEAGDLDKRLAGLSSEERIALLNDTLDHFQKMGNTEAVCEALFMLGTEYHSTGNLSNEKETYLIAAEMFNKAGNPNGEAISYNNLGYISKVSGEKKQALDYYDRALNIYRKAGSKNREAVILSNIGKLYFDNGEYLESIECFEDASELTKDSGDRSAESNFLFSLGNAYIKSNDLQRAIEILKKSLEIRKTLGDKNGVNSAVKLIAGTYLLMGDGDGAEKFILENSEVTWKPTDEANTPPFTEISEFKNSVNLSKTAESIFLRHREIAETKNIKTVFKAEDEEIFVKTDEGKLSEITGGLILNAIEQSSEGKTIYVYVGKRTGKARCEVIDEGIELSAEEAIKLITDKKLNTVEMAGGTLSHEGMAGRGNSFILEFEIA